MKTKILVAFMVLALFAVVAVGGTYMGSQFKITSTDGQNSDAEGSDKRRDYSLVTEEHVMEITQKADNHGLTGQTREDFIASAKESLALGMSLKAAFNLCDYAYGEVYIYE